MLKLTATTSIREYTEDEIFDLGLKHFKGGVLLDFFEKIDFFFFFTKNGSLICVQNVCKRIFR